MVDYRFALLHSHVYRELMVIVFDYQHFFNWPINWIFIQSEQMHCKMLTFLIVNVQTYFLLLLLVTG